MRLIKGWGHLFSGIHSQYLLGNYTGVSNHAFLFILVPIASIFSSSSWYGLRALPLGNSVNFSVNFANLCPLSALHTFSFSKFQVLLHKPLPQYFSLLWAPSLPPIVIPDIPSVYYSKPAACNFENRPQTHLKSDVALPEDLPWILLRVSSKAFTIITQICIVDDPETRSGDSAKTSRDTLRGPPKQVTGALETCLEPL